MLKFSSVDFIDCMIESNASGTMDFKHLCKPAGDFIVPEIHASKNVLFPISQYILMIYIKYSI